MSDTIVRIPHQWRPRSYQMPLWKWLHKDGPVVKNKFAANVWHRRAGKDLFSINLCAEQSMLRVGLYWHLFPTYNQGRKIAWEGFTKEGRKFLDHFPESVVEAKNDTEMRLKLTTGSIYQVVGTDNVDRLVGSNPVGCVFSEYSLQDPDAWHLIQPILAENDGWAVFIYTPRGHNHGYSLLENVKDDPDWFSAVLTVDDTKREDGSPVVTKEAIEKAKIAGMPEEKIQQEFYCSFDAPLVGAYYAQQMAAIQAKGQITDVPYDSNLPVHVVWDIGYDDATSLWFYQSYGFEIRLIDYYENSGEGMPHYIRVVKEKPYVYGRQYGPHDIEVHEFSTGKTRNQVAKEHGINFTVVQKHEVMDGIEAVRALIGRCWFDKTKCKRGIQALKEYSKEFDDNRKLFKDHPLHDWTSHAADCFRYLAWSFRDKSKRKDLPTKCVDEYQMLG